MKNYVIAHDLGTTGNKATLYDREGQLIGSAFYAYETEFAHAGWAEQNPEDWWRAVCASTKALLVETGVRGDEIACVTFSGQMMAAVPLDRHARPLRNAIIWADTRSIEQADSIAQNIPKEVVYKITGHRLSSSYSLTKIMWIRDHQPELYKATYKFVHAKDSIVARLTGAFVTEPSDASSMNLYDLEQGVWSQPMIDASGIHAEKLPEIIRSIDVAGEITPQVADEVGVAAGTPVVIGGGDGACASVGAGVVTEGAAYNYVGSSSWIAIASKQPIYDPAYKTFTFGHIAPDTFMPTGTMQAAGASYQWARDQLGVYEKHVAEVMKVSSYDLLNTLAAKSPPGANGLIYLPYLLGERSPRWNPAARGAFIGLTIRHTRADMLRAVLEGVTMNLKVILDAFTSQGTHIEAMRLIGGGAQGRFWNQIMADIYGMPVQRLAFLEEATSMGAAVAGGVGVGLYPDFSIIHQMNRVVETIEPIPSAQQHYATLFPIFEASYNALVPVYDMMVGL